MKLLATIMIMLSLFSVLVADTISDNEDCEHNINFMYEESFEENNECFQRRNSDIKNIERQIKELEKELPMENERSWNIQQSYQLGDLRSVLLNVHPTLCLPENEMEREHIIRLPKRIHNEPIQVVCDSKYVGPGWIVIQRRVNDSISFDHEYDIYEQGFGDMSGSFFIGLKNLYPLLSFSQHELYIYIEHTNGTSNFTHYDNFQIDGQWSRYKLKSLGNYAGDAGGLLQGALNNKFLPSGWKSSSKWWINSAKDSLG